MKAPNTSARSTHAGQNRVVKNDYIDALSDELKIEAVLATSPLWELAARVPAQRRGAPRKLPTVFYLAMLGLASVWDSFRDAQGQLKGRGEGRRLMWGHLCEMAVQYQAIHRPMDPPFDLKALKATSPLTAQNFFDARRSWLAPFMDELEEIFEEAMAGVADELGYGDASAEGSLNNLVRERCGTGDGKVVAEVGSRYCLLTSDEVADHNKGKPPRKKITPDSHVVDRRTGEIIPVTKMVGEQLYHTGDGLKIGHKFLAWSMRDDETNSSLVMSLRIQKTTSEAQELTNGALRLKQLLPGLLGVITDAALRGEHNYQILRAGMVPVNPIAAKSDDGETRVEKSGYFETLTHAHPNGHQCRHEVHYYGGGMVEWRPNDKGEATRIDFGTPHVRERRDKSGSRMYAEFSITCRDGLDDKEPTIDLGVVRVNVTTPATGGKNELNIPENIRLVPPGRDTYTRVYGWRNNAENDNRQRDHRKFLARARSHGAQRQHWNELGGALVQNGVALLLHRERVATRTADLAA
jgi:hypothetical protein